MAFRLTIDLGNAAMKSRGDVAEALGKVLPKVMQENEGAIRDHNGNKVGHWEFTDAPED